MRIDLANTFLTAPIYFLVELCVGIYYAHDCTLGRASGDGYLAGLRGRVLGGAASIVLVLGI